MQIELCNSIPTVEIKKNLKEAENELKNTYAPGNKKTIERLALIGKIEAYKELLKEEK